LKEKTRAALSAARVIFLQSIQTGRPAVSAIILNLRSDIFCSICFCFICYYSSFAPSLPSEALKNTALRLSPSKRGVSIWCGLSAVMAQKLFCSEKYSILCSGNGLARKRIFHTSEIISTALRLFSLQAEKMLTS